jgi:hypothetical protein
MKIDKNLVLDFLRSRGQDDKVPQADQELPQEVDTDRDQNLLSRFGIDINDLLSKLPGGLADKIPGGLTDKLGGFLGGNK